MSELLRMEHISKRFGSFYANKDISLTVNRGEVLTLLGENGAGKSTLMNILIGLYQPTEGKIFLEGKEVRIESPSQAVKLGIGMVHQHFMLVEAMTVFDNIILGDKHAKGLFIDRAARRKEIEELSAKYGLDVQLDRLITEISVIRRSSCTSRPYLADSSSISLRRAARSINRPLACLSPRMMLSNTVMASTSMKCWCTMPMPSFTA